MYKLFINIIMHFPFNIISCNSDNSQIKYFPCQRDCGQSVLPGAGQVRGAARHQLERGQLGSGEGEREGNSAIIQLRNNISSRIAPARHLQCSESN